MSKNEKHRKILEKKVHTDHKKKLASGAEKKFVTFVTIIFFIKYKKII
jgi:hypothetical protein